MPLNLYFTTALCNSVSYLLTIIRESSVHIVLRCYFQFKLTWAENLSDLFLFGFIVSVCLSVCPSVNLLHFWLLLLNHWANFSQALLKVLLSNEDSSLLNWMTTPTERKIPKQVHFLNMWHIWKKGIGNFRYKPNSYAHDIFHKLPPNGCHNLNKCSS